MPKEVTLQLVPPPCFEQTSFDVSQDKESLEEEQEANLFAGHFLMPEKAFADAPCRAHWIAEPEFVLRAGVEIEEAFGNFDEGALLAQAFDL